MTYRQEPDTLPVRTLAIVAAISAVVFGAAMGVSWAMTPRAVMHVVLPRAEGPMEGVDRDPIAGPARGRERHEQARARLERWERIDDDAARIPISHAIALVVAGVRPETP